MYIQELQIPELQESVSEATTLKCDQDKKEDYDKTSSIIRTIATEQDVDLDSVPHKDTVLLIDIENCPTQIKQLQSNLISFSQVFICYAQNNCPKIPIDWLNSLAITINENRLKIIKMKTATKNSADFGICFFSGMLMESLPKETHFIIVSHDSDLDHTIELLRSQGRSAERIGIVKENNKTLLDIDDSLAAYCKYLITHTGKPTKKESLINSINSKFKGMPSVAESVFQELINQSIVEIVENGKVNYNITKLNNFE